ncbi:hypothetical protein [Nocardioides alkalitolerans]|uniref:hypothetical protein n=1 Tax=Nocardioides alkalitolerans TaxID=281714 RepID=UPI00040B36FF|nr:hypothetical protein [Nocardioides alkalitolerans]
MDLTPMTPEHEAAVSAELVRLTLGHPGRQRPELVKRLTLREVALEVGRIVGETVRAVARVLDEPAMRALGHAHHTGHDPDAYTLIGD